MKLLLEWVQQIAVFYLFMTMIEQLLPSGSYRKYMRLYAGLVFVMLVLSPIVNLPQLGAGLTEALEEAKREMEKEHLKLEKEAGNEGRYRMVLQGYQTMIRERVQDLVSKEGFVLHEMEVVFEENAEADNFAQIYSMKIDVIGTKTEPILHKLQEELAQEYQMNQTQIEISVREGA